MLKYNPGAQETYDEAVARNPCMLRRVPDHFKKQEMCENAVRMNSGREKFRTPCGLLLPMPSILFFIPDHLKTRGTCEKAVEKNLWGLDDVLDDFKTQGMCNESVCREPWLLNIIPDRLKTQDLCNKAVLCS